ncbi:sulfhydrogenase subunit delta [Candidatus Albibeggiatoa sp. nov. NOAA]|uniref:NADH-quinone oxidoreductase subunit B family protein n=1 Tax=Candidatus Albibeggiatoa sp. nov. NOAA TaxID=3162724 RepID=UPI0032FA93C9|nr:sulfhydrogenase subunit delta [Thiotrichaceae bacterium]
MLLDIKRFHSKPKIAVHKFSSCDGCQLAFLNAGQQLLALSDMLDIIHFVEAGPINPEEPVDIAFIEGSVSTSEEAERIDMVRKNSQFLVTIGACATSGGIQALRNINDVNEWTKSVYAQPEFIESLSTATPIAKHVRVDLEIWGCPINSYQILSAIRALLFGVIPYQEQDKVCLECKRMHNTCVMVAKGAPCMGPVTQTGCGAICPSMGRDCYACYGPAEQINGQSLGQRIQGLGYQPEQVARKFAFINNAAPSFAQASETMQEAQS